MSRPVTLVVAATVPHLGIGINGGLPWRLSKDMKFFRDVTTANGSGTVIMGRNTWESIPPKFRPLKSRTNIVVTTRPLDCQEGVLTASSFEQALSRADDQDARGPLFVIGGGQLYASALKHARSKHVLLTEIDSDITCDTFFGPFPWYGHDENPTGDWIRQPYSTLAQLVGMPELTEQHEEKGVKYRFTLWTKA